MECRKTGDDVKQNSKEESMSMRQGLLDASRVSFASNAAKRHDKLAELAEKPTSDVSVLLIRSASGCRR